jgi:GIY-YIG catalytic domain
MTRGVYQIRNVLTGDCYIGQSIDIEGRWAQHRSNLFHRSHQSYALQAAWDEYGSHAFTWEVVEEVPPGIDLLTVEARHIQTCPSRYNIAGAVLRPPRPIHTIRMQRHITPEEEGTTSIVLHTLACSCCRLAIRAERHVYPGLGQIIEIRQPDADGNGWTTLSTHVFREDGSEVLFD